ncbi:TetR/AcrR family transcriptional regulator [Kineothrix sp. MB12-C1]|uniref:TetR/AcrR family transcriptional regulator n=1 Tax=Kineothrix sp. MB12-C1 TaxID=3070215 RepID=UPI0027D2C236|nr:TetR/AcrR family transcriptional regulator [Kineothrix sp. MB12-C1]WMC94108.1 TetR/AcrR family transcriptional regulator [Kineothrix sp. MB12-C1]
MPRFSENEKEQIKTRLLAEGERLFATYGLKKITINEIVSAVNIAKATFYTFYDSKEYLFLDIVQNIQLNIFMELDLLLETNIALTNKQRVRQVFSTMYDLMLQFPILSQIDNRTLELISRKVSKERLSVFANQNLDAVFILDKHEIKFNCTLAVASHTFQALYHGWLSLQGQKSEIQEMVLDILLNGVIEQIVND